MEKRPCPIGWKHVPVSISLGSKADAFDVECRCGEVTAVGTWHDALPDDWDPVAGRVFVQAGQLISTTNPWDARCAELRANDTLHTWRNCKEFAALSAGCAIDIQPHAFGAALLVIQDDNDELDIAVRFDADPRLDLVVRIWDGRTEFHPVSTGPEAYSIAIQKLRQLKGNDAQTPSDK